MAGPLLSLSLPPPSPHTLRTLPLFLFPPAFLLLLLHGILSSRVNPAIGILPLFSSAAYSAALLANATRCGCGSAGLAGSPVHLVCDLVVGVADLVCLVLAWVSLETRRGGVMLGTYGTNFLVLDFLVHFYFVFVHLRDAIRPGSTYPAACPQCQFGPFPWTIKVERNGYAPLLGGEGEAGEVGGEELRGAEAAV